MWANKLSRLKSRKAAIYWELKRPIVSNQTLQHDQHCERYDRPDPLARSLMTVSFTQYAHLTLYLDARTHELTHPCTHARKWVCACMRACMRACVRGCACVHACMCVCTCACACVCVCAHVACFTKKSYVMHLEVRLSWNFIRYF